ncbi:MAG: PadR family transcriptional regulator [Cyclobacteriaceae bacterium]
MKGTTIGELEELCLLSVGILHHDAYGITVQTEIEHRTNRKPTISTIHSTLIRLEKKGLLQSRLGGATEKRGGRTKRLFSLTAEGQAVIEEARNVRIAMWDELAHLKTSGT